jgi:uncharacterized OB-fold protein
MNYGKLQRQINMGKGFKMICNECGKEMIFQQELTPECYDENNIQVSFIRNDISFGFICICGNSAYVST